MALSDATFGPLIPLGVTFEPQHALLGGPRPSRVVAPDQRESLRERKSDQTKQDDMIRRRNKKSIYIYIYMCVYIYIYIYVYMGPYISILRFLAQGTGLSAGISGSGLGALVL